MYDNFEQKPKDEQLALLDSWIREWGIPLTFRERQMLELRFGLDWAYKRIGEEFGITASRAREIVSRSIRFLGSCAYYRRNVFSWARPHRRK